jgi:hypothetical protein
MHMVKICICGLCDFLTHYKNNDDLESDSN